MGRRMTLKGQISLCLAAFFLALAGQIFLSFYQSGTVLRELDDQMGNFNAISRFQNGVERSLSAMEDYRIDIMIDKGPSARSIQIDLNPFTLVGATTRSGLLTAPLRARFGINLHLEYYDDDILSNIIRRSASILDVPCSVRALSLIHI